jgi:hypothetical protein
MGAANNYIDRRAPLGSFIDVRNFPTVKDLADYLIKLDTNQVLLKSSILADFEGLAEKLSNLNFPPVLINNNRVDIFYRGLDGKNWLFQISKPEIYR